MMWEVSATLSVASFLDLKALPLGVLSLEALFCCCLLAWPFDVLPPVVVPEVVAALVLEEVGLVFCAVLLGFLADLLVDGEVLMALEAASWEVLVLSWSSEVVASWLALGFMPRVVRRESSAWLAATASAEEEEEELLVFLEGAIVSRMLVGMDWL
jgi:hypothetical protein